MEANTIIQATHSSYKTVADQFNNLWVQNTNNVLTYKVSSNLNYKLTADPRPRDLAVAFKQVFSAERLAQLEADEKQMSITFTLDPDGNVLETEFIVRPDTTLTVLEFEALEDAIKDVVYFEIYWPNDDKHTADIVGISHGFGYDNFTFKPGSEERRGLFISQPVAIDLQYFDTIIKNFESNKGE